MLVGVHTLLHEKDTHAYSWLVVYYCIFADFPTKNIVYTLYIYGSGQPYICCIRMQVKEPFICRATYKVYKEKALSQEYDCLSEGNLKSNVWG